MYLHTHIYILRVCACVWVCTYVHIRIHCVCVCVCVRTLVWSRASAFRFWRFYCGNVYVYTFYARILHCLLVSIRLSVTHSTYTRSHIIYMFTNQICVYTLVVYTHEPEISQQTYFSHELHMIYEMTYYTDIEMNVFQGQTAINMSHNIYKSHELTLFTKSHVKYI